MSMKNEIQMLEELWLEEREQAIRKLAVNPIVANLSPLKDQDYCQP